MMIFLTEVVSIRSRYGRIIDGSQGIITKNLGDSQNAITQKIDKSQGVITKKYDDILTMR